MRKLALLTALFASNAFATPFIVSDPIPPADGHTATHCSWSFDGGARTDTPVLDTGNGVICSIDLAPLNLTGQHTVNATAYVLDPIFGKTQESDPSANFTFGPSPVKVNAPSGLRLQK